MHGREGSRLDHPHLQHPPTNTETPEDKKIQSMLTTTVLLIIFQELGGVGVLTFPFLTAQYCSEGAW